MDHGSSSEEVDDLARALFHRADSTNVWGDVDECIRFFFRREAARRLQQQRYKKSAERL